MALGLSTLQRPLIETIALGLSPAPDTFTFADLEEQLHALFAQLSRMDKLHTAKIWIRRDTMTDFLGYQWYHGSPTDSVVQKISAMRKRGLVVEFTVIIPYHGLVLSVSCGIFIRER